MVRGLHDLLSRTSLPYPHHCGQPGWSLDWRHLSTTRKHVEFHDWLVLAACWLVVGEFCRLVGFSATCQNPVQAVADGDGKSVLHPSLHTGVGPFSLGFSRPALLKHFSHTARPGGYWKVTFKFTLMLWLDWSFRFRYSTAEFGREKLPANESEVCISLPRAGVGNRARDLTLQLKNSRKTALVPFFDPTLESQEKTTPTSLKIFKRFWGLRRPCPAITSEMLLSGDFWKLNITSSNGITKTLPVPVTATWMDRKTASE